MAKAKKGNSAKKSKARKQSKPEIEGDNVRSLAPPAAVKAFINHVIATKNATSEAGQGLSTATKRATDQGVNIPAARIAARLLSKAKQDGLKARVLWEDVIYYLIECTEFDRIAPAGMFTAEESGQKRSHKRKQPKQEELPVDEPEQPVQEMSDQEAAAVVH